VDLRLPFITPQQISRALDDLHALAEAARSLPEIESRLVGRVDALESRAAGVLELGETIDTQADRLIASVAQAEGRVGDLLGRADKLDGRIDEVLEQFALVERQIGEITTRVDRGEARIAEILAMGDMLASRADDVARQGARVADAIPTLEEAVRVVEDLAPTAQALASTVEPLQGAAERLGRIVDRFPGGSRPRPRHDEDEPAA
jgi:methyl-accepting chemotaxis protein